MSPKIDPPQKSMQEQREGPCKANVNVHKGLRGLNIDWNQIVRRLRLNSEGRDVSFDMVAVYGTVNGDAGRLPLAMNVDESVVLGVLDIITGNYEGEHVPRTMDLAQRDHLRYAVMAFAQAVETRKAVGKGTAIEVLGENGTSEIVVGVGQVGIKDDVAILVTPNYGPKRMKQHNVPASAFRKAVDMLVRWQCTIDCRAHNGPAHENPLDLAEETTELLAHLEDDDMPPAPCKLCQSEKRVHLLFEGELEKMTAGRDAALGRLEHACNEGGDVPTGELERNFHTSNALLRWWLRADADGDTATVAQHTVEHLSKVDPPLVDVPAGEPIPAPVRSRSEILDSLHAQVEAMHKMVKENPAALLKACNLCGEPLDDVNGACKGPHTEPRKSTWQEDAERVTKQAAEIRARQREFSEPEADRSSRAGARLKQPRECLRPWCKAPAYRNSPYCTVHPDESDDRGAG